MARNKLAAQARRHHRDRRDVRRVSEETGKKLDTIATGPTPSHMVASQELLLHFRQALTEEERQLADRRAQGRT
jgi:hypothetical protein